MRDVFLGRGQKNRFIRIAYMLRVDPALTCGETLLHPLAGAQVSGMRYVFLGRGRKNIITGSRFCASRSGANAKGSPRTWSAHSNGQVTLLLKNKHECNPRVTSVTLSWSNIQFKDIFLFLFFYYFISQAL
jgi:hypothetical protein